MHTTAFAIPPRPTTPRPGFYSGCTRGDFLSILYPRGREAATPIPPSVPTSDDAKPKRKKFGGLVKNLSGLFRKGDKSKLKGPNTLVVEPISSTTELRTAGLMSDASEEPDGGRYRASAGLGRGSESADALNELIDAHSNSDLGSKFGSSDSIPWSLLPRFPDPPTDLTAPAPATEHPNRSKTRTGLAISSPASTSEPSGCQSFSMSSRPKRSALPSLQFFKHRSESGEYNRRSVFRRALDAIKIRRLPRRLNLGEKVKALALNQIKVGSAKATQVWGTSILPTSPVPDLIVTAYEDSTRVVFRLEDSGCQDSEPVEPGLLFPDYIRENYPTDRRLAELPRLTLSMSDWNTNLMAIAEDEEEGDDGYQSRFSDSDSEPDFTAANDSRSSSQDSSPPLTPMSGEMPLPPAVFASAGKSTLIYKVDDGDNAVGVAL